MFTFIHIKLLFFFEKPLRSSCSIYFNTISSKIRRYDWIRDNLFFFSSFLRFPSESSFICVFLRVLLQFRMNQCISPLESKSNLIIFISWLSHVFDPLHEIRRGFSHRCDFWLAYCLLTIQSSLNGAVWWLDDLVLKAALVFEVLSYLVRIDSMCTQKWISFLNIGLFFFHVGILELSKHIARSSVKNGQWRRCYSCLSCFSSCYCICCCCFLFVFVNVNKLNF